MRVAFPNMVLVDAGDSFGGISEPEKRKAEVILRAMGVMGYDALCVGENELNYGGEFIVDAAREAKVPLVCANLVYSKTSKSFVEPYVIVKRGKLRVAIIGLLDDVLVIPSSGGVVDELTILDPIKMAHEIVPSLKKKVDVTVVLAHMGYAKSTKLANEIPEIDVIVTGHSPSISHEARKEANSLLVMSGTRGQYVSYLMLTLSAGKLIETYESKLIPLDGRIKLQGMVQTLTEEYNTQEKRIMEERSRKDQEEALSRTGENRYLGQETCKRCHEEVFQKVAAVGHARAYESLEKTHSEGLAECLVCHTTGYGQPSGFQTASSSPDLKNVQCEACHGMGTAHRRDGSYRQVSEKNCLACHTKDRSPDFNYKAYLQKIQH